MFVTQFKAGHDGRLSGDRPGYHHFKVFVDKSEKDKPEPWGRYLVEIVHQPNDKKYCFVRIVVKVGSLFNDLLPLLLEAEWQRGRDIHSDPSAVVTHPHWGDVEVKFHKSGGRFGGSKYAYVTLNPNGGFGEKTSFEVRTGEVNFDELEKHVHRQVGPAPAFAAALSRQAEFARRR